MTSAAQPYFIQALRASAALTILWHHFALYAPLTEWAAPLLGDLLSWLARYARATQVFFVVSGFVAAQTIGTRVWRFSQLGRRQGGVAELAQPGFRKLHSQTLLACSEKESW